ncbi:hypothetical protein CPB83DRAFT_35497 [Crepidotus variabilis]|uniref:Uncharacterized protein n=1 Tax=Crepidotus variabilis TaxID=179855 RepID=A0A9P6JVS9_9AGAR|nr:hypothetical protein CPB83DRAFT_35497 [Crepidotus variabilis]
MSLQVVQIDPADALFTPTSLEHLPNYEEATGQAPRRKSPNGRLPPFKRCRSARYHPYKRFLVDTADEIDSFIDTIFDPEQQALDVPPALPDRQRAYPLLLDYETMIDQRIRIILMAERAQQLDDALIANDFLASFTGTRY